MSAESVVAGFIVLGFVIGVYIAYNTINWSGISKLRDVSNFISYSVLYSFMGMVSCFFIGLVVILGYSEFADYKEFEKRDVYINSINRGSEMNGNFFLGSGSIDTKQYYFYYYKSTYGYKLSKIEAYNTYIVETNDMKPQIVKTYKDYDDGFISLKDGNVSIRNIIYVPKNTIVKDFVLN